MHSPQLSTSGCRGGYCRRCTQRITSSGVTLRSARPVEKVLTRYAEATVIIVHRSILRDLQPRDPCTAGVSACPIGCRRVPDHFRALGVSTESRPLLVVGDIDGTFVRIFVGFLVGGIVGTSVGCSVGWVVRKHKIK